MAIHHLWPETSGGSAAWDPQLNDSKRYDSTQAKEIQQHQKSKTLDSGPNLCIAPLKHDTSSADELCSISYKIYLDT